LRVVFALLVASFHHDEASLYGPINSLLTFHFPVVRQYMIKPQGKIRPQHSSDIADDEEMVRVSLDSYDGEVLSRDEKGGEQSVKVPDFTVSKRLPLFMAIVF